MGRNASNHLESPVRVRGSPHRRSPSRREKSPTRHRSSHRGSSPAREKYSVRAKSPKHVRRSSSPVARSPSPRTKRLSKIEADREVERENERTRLPSPRTKRLRKTDAEREVERENERARSPSPRTKRLRKSEAEREVERENERVRSLSPRTKRLRRAQDERGSERETEKENERNQGRGSDKGTHREKGSDREIGSEKKERRSGRDDSNSKSSRSRHERSASPSDRHHRSRHRSRSPQLDADDTRARDEVENSRGAEGRNDEDDSVARMKAAEEALEAKEKHKPSFELSGKLAGETNRFRGVTLLFNEPPDARKPDVRWRLYVFKGGEVLNEPLYIHRQSCYLFGRERRVADIPTDHPSCSKQHAVIQFRQVEKEQPDGTLKKQVRPYVMDLGSTNKTFVNDNAIEPQRYYELIEKDTIRFGNSSREYVLLHENSAE